PQPSAFFTRRSPGRDLAVDAEQSIDRLPAHTYAVVRDIKSNAVGRSAYSRADGPAFRSKFDSVRKQVSHNGSDRGLVQTDNHRFRGVYFEMDSLLAGLLRQQVPVLDQYVVKVE